jgi:hypothetical protein
VTIPEARRLLLNLAATLDPKSAAEIQRIVREGMHRRRGVPLTPPKSKPMTRGLAGQIRVFYGRHPGLSEQEIAVKMGVNAGRVSEALIGKRV